MAVAVPRILKSGLFAWVAAAVAMMYFIFSFDYSAFMSGEGCLRKRFMNAFSMPKINLGIDLRGGTRLVLRADLEKSIEARLFDTAKNIERYLRKSRIALPVKKDVINGTLDMRFVGDDQAANALAKIKEGFSTNELDVVAKGSSVSISLVAGYKDRIKSTAIDQAVNVLRTRLDTIDIRGLTVSKHGSTNVVVMLPGMSSADAKDIKAAIARSARLDFKIVEATGHSKKTLLQRFGGVLPPDKMMLSGKEGSNDEDSGECYIVSIFADVSGKNISDARVSYDQFSRPQIAFEMNSEGAREMREVTGKNIGKQLAIIMDGKVHSAPNINAEIGKSGSITGSYSYEEASRMVALLKSGSLDAPLIIEQENCVGASLGQDSINKGLGSCLLALLMLFFFALAYYRLAGFFAFLALVYNMLLLLAFLSYFKATLTLPGIAGVVLTLGMAIDASILIYESIREALRKGILYRDAVTVGFKDAMAVILDSNITTFIAGLVLFWWGGPAVKGFAVTLMLGIISTVISGVFFLKALFTFVLDGVGVKKISL